MFMTSVKDWGVHAPCRSIGRVVDDPSERALRESSSAPVGHLRHHRYWWAVVVVAAGEAAVAPYLGYR